jgi:hypothetical protein
MKTITLFILFLGLASSTSAQYAHAPANDTGIYTTESASGGDKIHIVRNTKKNNLTIDYQLNEEFNKAVLIVKEPIGKIIVMEELENTRDQILILTDNWPTGQYTVSLFADKKTIMTKKISISK